MSSWSLLLCEGAHDQEFLCCLGTQAQTWIHTKKQPPNVLATLSSGTKYHYLIHDEKALVIANLNGIDNILGRQGIQLVENSLSARTVGVIIDADDRGVVTRRDEVRRHFSPVLPAASLANPGSVVPGANNAQNNRRFGLWVAPNCSQTGSLDDVIRIAADSVHPTLTPIADRFVAEIGNEANHQWGQFREKAVLGSIGQLWRAGGSLASALMERREWITREMTTQAPFSDILHFMEELISDPG